MNILKFMTRHRLIGAAILSVLLIAGCGPAPLGTSWAGLSKIENDILVTYNDRIVLVNPADGKAVRLLNPQGEVRLDDQGNPRVWDVRHNAPNMFFSTPVQLSDDTLLVAAYNQQLLEIDIPTARIENPDGQTIAGYTGSVVADLLRKDDLIYVGLSAKDLVALNRDDLSVAWKLTTEHGVWSKPLLVEDTLYVSSLDHKLYAADANTGELLWKLDLQGAVPSSPAYDERSGHLFVGTFGRKIFEIAREGQVVNQYDTLDWIWGTPVIDNGILYAADLVGNVYALDTTQNLKEVWKQKVAASAIRPTPVVQGDFVLVASRDQKLYWLNRSDGTPVVNNEGQPLVREMQASIFADILLFQGDEVPDINEPFVVVSTMSPSQMLVAYTVAEGRFLWAYAYS